MTTFVSNLAAIDACNAIVDRLDGGSPGHLLIYAGSVPADCDAGLGGATLLADLTLSNPAFGTAVDATGKARATANAITADTDANATGTATFFRATNSAGTAVIQGSVGTSGANLNLNSVAIQANAEVSVSSWTYDFSETGT